MLSLWLAALPLQLSQLGHRNPALSDRLLLSIQAAASRGNKALLNSLQTLACRLYGEYTHTYLYAGSTVNTHTHTCMQALRCIYNIKKHTCEAPLITVGQIGTKQVVTKWPYLKIPK